MAMITKAPSDDLCDVCATQTGTCVQILYPTNAEHAARNTPNDNSIRICLNCAQLIVDVAKGDKDWVETRST